MTDQLEELSGPELIDRAMNEGDEAARDAAIARINQKAGTVKRALDAGVSSADFSRLDSVHSALLASGKVVSTAWDIVKSQRS